MLRTWSFTNSIASSTNACVLEGTPEVALRTTSQRKPSTRTPRMAEVTIVSKWIVQNPPCSLTGSAKNVRWCWMYDVASSSCSAAIVLRSVPNQNRRLRNEHGDDESRQKRPVHDLAVARQHEPDLQHDDRDFRRLGPDHRAHGRGGARRAAEPDQHREYDAGRNIDKPPKQTGNSPVPARPPPPKRGNHRARQHLPQGDAGGRITLRGRTRSGRHRTPSKPLDYRGSCRYASTNAAVQNRIAAVHPSHPKARTRSSLRRLPVATRPSPGAAVR